MWILVRKKCGFDVTNFSQVNRDLVILKLKNSKINMTIMGVYAPSHGDPTDFFREVSRQLINDENTYKMLIGDLNVCPDLVMDRDNYRADNRKGSRLIINSWITGEKIIQMV